MKQFFTLLTALLPAILLCGCMSSHHASSYAAYYPPQIPRIGIATDQGSFVHVTWTGSAKYYQIERAEKYTGGEDYDQFITVHTVTDSAQSWDDTGAPLNSLVKYRVRASSDDYLWTDCSSESIPVARGSNAK